MCLSGPSGDFATRL